MTTRPPATGPDRHLATVREVALMWAGHYPGPFPEVPLDDKLDLAYLDLTVAGCVSTYLGNGGVPGHGHLGILRNCLPELQTAVVLLERSAEYHEGLTAFRRLLTMAELILAAGS
ncbi:hypothetical protein ACFVVU_36000 [Kitasatospora sp. NPDC057965]|uniref:hypothetical protein n=1 Tax=Kitasatospora sp. NPDC057965 TaxID=3346291 RepID=UPI0036D98221